MGKELEKRTDICICITESLCCTPETNTTLLINYVHAVCQLLHSCLTLCDPMDCSPPGSSVHGILQARILEWVAMPSSRRSSQPRAWIHVSSSFWWFQMFLGLWEHHSKLRSCPPLVAQLCPTRCNPLDCSPLGSSDHGILQARILEWVSIPFSRGSSQPRDRTHDFSVSCITGRFLPRFWTSREATNPLCSDIKIKNK